MVLVTQLYFSSTLAQSKSRAAWVHLQMLIMVTMFLWLLNLELKVILWIIYQKSEKNVDNMQLYFCKTVFDQKHKNKRDK